jgi:hypothetical protein
MMVDLNFIAPLISRTAAPRQAFCVDYFSRLRDLLPEQAVDARGQGLIISPDPSSLTINHQDDLRNGALISLKSQAVIERFALIPVVMLDLDEWDAAGCQMRFYNITPRAVLFGVQFYRRLLVIRGGVIHWSDFQ